MEIGPNGSVGSVGAFCWGHLSLTCKYHCRPERVRWLAPLGGPAWRRLLGDLLAPLGVLNSVFTKSTSNINAKLMSKDDFDGNDEESLKML